MKKRVLSLLLTMVMMVSLLPNAFAAKKPTFTDVNKDMWCYDYVEFVAKKGYFKGTTETTFAPNGTMTRQQFVTVLARMAGAKVDNSVTVFTDVPANTYSTGSIAWAVKHGIVNGYADGTFKPTNPVTRQQMAAFMSRFMDYYTKVYGAYFLKKPTASTFADYEQIANAEFKTAVDRCRAYGLIEGYADGFYRPANQATRAHVAAVITRLAKVMRMAGGGGSGSSDIALTYVSAPLGVEKTHTVYDEDGLFTALDYTDVHADPAEYAGMYFLNWTNEEETFSVMPGEQIWLDDDASIYANWADQNDLLYLAIGKTVNRLSNKGLLIAAPATVVNGARDINLVTGAVLDTDIVPSIIETAAYNAVQLIGSAEYAASAGAEFDPITKAEVKDIVLELLDVVDPAGTWKAGNGYAEKLELLVETVYTKVKAEAIDIWNLYKYNGALIFDEIALKDGAATLAVIKNDLKLYNADGSALSYKLGVARVAKAIAKDMVASLKKYSDYTTELCLTGDLTADFGMASHVEAMTAGFPTAYNVNVDLDLCPVGADQYLAYKYDNGRSYVKLMVTADLQAEYEKAVNAVAEAALTNPTAKAYLKDTMTEKIGAVDMSLLTDAMVQYGVVATEAAAKAKVEAALKGAVDEWLEENLDTRASGAADFYLPYDYFWVMEGDVDANGKILTGDTTRHLFNNEALISVVNALVDETIEKGLAVMKAEYKDQLMANGIPADMADSLLDAITVDMVKQAMGFDADTLAATLNTEIAKAAGAFSTYLNKVGAARTFAGLTDVELNELVKVLKSDLILSKLDGESEDLVLAVADKLAQYGDLDVDAFAGEGIAVDVPVTVKGQTYTISVNFVIEVQ